MLQHESRISHRLANKVHVIGPHLLDRSLPYDLWTHEAELAAIVYLLMQRPDLDVSAAMPSIVRDYNRSNNLAGIATRRFNATRTGFSIRAIRHFIELAAPGLYPAGVYAALLGSPLAMADFVRHFYSAARLRCESAFAGFLEPDVLPLTNETLAAHLWQACAGRAEHGTDCGENGNAAIRGRHRRLRFYRHDGAVPARPALPCPSHHGI
jgi:hypothetical protein